jgi:hypothetical protein
MEQRLEVYQVPVKPGASVGALPSADSVALNKLLQPLQQMHWRIASMSSQIVPHPALNGRPGPSGTSNTEYTAFITVLWYHTETT